MTGEVLWGAQTGWGASKFVIAPTGTVIACAAWSAMMREPYADAAFTSAAARARRDWLAFGAAGAVLLALGQGPLFFADKVLWFRPIAGAALVSAALLLPGIVAAVATAARRDGDRGALTIWVAAVAVTSAMAALFATGLTYDCNPSQRVCDPISDNPRGWFAFAASHALATAGIGASLALAPRLMTRLRPLL